MNKFYNKILFGVIFLLFVLKNTLFINSNVFNIAFAIVILIFAISYFFSNKIYKITRRFLLFFIIVLFLLLQGLLLTYHFGFSYYKYFYDSIRYLSFLGLFIFGCFSAAHINIKKICIVFILIFIYHIIPAYYSLLTGQANVLFSNIRVSGEFQNVGQFGMLMGLAFIIFYILFLKSRVLSYKIIFAFLIILALAILAFNNTLRIFAAIVFAFTIYYILYKRKIKYLFIIAFFVLLLILFNAQVYQRLYELFTVSYKLEELSEMKFDNSFQWRIMQWYLLTSDWIKNYFISGVGLGQQTMLKGFIAPWGEPFVAHSDFVKLLVETGFIGFPLILIICFSIASFIKKKMYVSQFALVILYFLFCLLTGNTMFSNPFQIFIFLIGYLSSYKEY